MVTKKIKEKGKIMEKRITENKKFCSALKGAACLVLMLILSGTSAFAAEGATGFITTPFNTLTTIVSTIISSIGTIVTLWGISEFGIALQSHDGTSQAQAFKRIAGGLVMIVAPQIVTLF